MKQGHLKPYNGANPSYNQQIYNRNTLFKSDSDLIFDLDCQLFAF
jgi:hypothetical protein